MVDDALVLHLANKLAALEHTRAEAPHASPTWRGLDAVEAASREVIAAAHALVVAFNAAEAPPAYPKIHAVAPPGTAPLLRLGDRVLNLDRVNYFTISEDCISAWFGPEDDIQFRGEWRDSMDMWLSMNVDEDMGPAQRLPPRGADA